jgi:hypothetical protein
MELITLGYLSAQELERYREMRALKTLAEKGHLGLDLPRAVSAVMEHDVFMHELSERFELDEEALIYVNSYNGRVVERG